MTEQEQQNSQSKIKKKFRFASRIVWLTWTGVLSLFLVAGLFLQAPWKVTALVFIFLLAATILPRAYRKWFWAVIGCAGAAIIVWVFLPEDSKGWRPYTFDKELAALEAKCAIPDGENAAVIYNQLFEDYNESVFKSNFISPNNEECITKEPWSSKDCPEVARWLGQQKSTITKLIETSKIEQCRFPIIAEVRSVGDIMHRLNPMQNWAVLLTWAANNDMAEGRINQALEKYIAVLQMGEQLRQQPSMLDFLVGTGIERNSTSRLKIFVVTGEAAEEHLNLIAKALAEIEHDWSYDFPKLLEHEKLLVKNLFGMFYEVNTEGKIRLTRSLGNTIRKHLSQNMKDEPIIKYWHKRLIKASAILCWFYVPAVPQQAGAIVDAAYGRYYAMAVSGSSWAKDPREFSITSIRFNYRYMIEMQLYIMDPVYCNIHDAYLRTIAQERGSRLIVALRRYKNKSGSWPVSLDEVKSSAAEEVFIDPINGGSFVYKLDTEDFILYSKGENNIDENNRDDSDDWPIW